MTLAVRSASVFCRVKVCKRRCSSYSTYLNYHRNFGLKVQVTISRLSISMGLIFSGDFSIYLFERRRKKNDLMHYFCCVFLAVCSLFGLIPWATCELSPWIKSRSGMFQIDSWKKKQNRNGNLMNNLYNNSRQKRAKHVKCNAIHFSLTVTKLILIERFHNNAQKNRSSNENVSMEIHI